MASASNQPSSFISLIGSARPDGSQGIANVQFEDGNSIVKTLPACVVCIPPDEESLRNVLYLLDDVHNIKYFAIGPWFKDVRPELNSFTKVTIWCNRFRKKDTPEKFEIVHSDFLRIVNEKFINFFVLPLWSDARKREVKSDFLKEWSSRIVLCKTPKDICEFYHEFSFFGFKKEQLGTKREQRIRRSFRKRLSSSELENSLFKYNGFRINWNDDGTACYMKDIDYKTLMNFGIISLLERKRPDHYKVVGCYIKNQGNQIKIYSLLSEDPFSVHVVEGKRLPEILANTPSQPASNGSIEPLPVNSTRCHPGSNTEPNSLEASVRPSPLPISPARDVSRTPLSPPLSPPPPPPPPEQTATPQRVVTDSDQPVDRTGQHGSPQRLNTDSGQPVGRTGQHGSPQSLDADSGQPEGRTGQHGSPQRVNTDSDQPVDRTGQHGSPQSLDADSGQPVDRTGQHGSSQSLDADSGQPVDRTGQHGSPQRVVTDSGQPEGRTGQHGSLQRVNTDSGQPVGRTGQHGSPQRVNTDSGQPVGRTGQHGSPQRSNTDSGQPVSNPAQHSSQQGPGISTSQSVDNSRQHVNVTVTLNMNGSSHSINANSGRPVSSPGQHDFPQGESSSFNERGTVSNQPRQQSSTLQRPSQSRSNGDVERASYGSWPRRIYPQHAARRSFIEENFKDLLLNLSPRVSVDWRTLGGHLRLEPYELSNMDDEYRRTEDKAYQMLLKWKQKNGRAATPQGLVAALRATGRNDLSDIVQEFAITGRYNIDD